MSLATLKNDLVALESAVSSLKPAPILRALAPVEIDVAEIIELFDPPTVGSKPKASATPPTFGVDPDKADVLACCDRIEAECTTKKAPAVAAWGDGTLFNIFLQNLPALLAMIRDLLKK